MPSPGFPRLNTLPPPPEILTSEILSRLRFISPALLPQKFDLLALADEIYLRRRLNDFGLGEKDGSSYSGYAGISGILTGDGVTKSYYLYGLQFSSSYPVFIYLNLVLQTSGYTWAAGSVNFTTAPASGVSILIVFIYNG